MSNAGLVRSALQLDDVTDDQLAELETELQRGGAVQTAHGMFVLWARKPLVSS